MRSVKDEISKNCVRSMSEFKIETYTIRKYVVNTMKRVEILSNLVKEYVFKLEEALKKELLVFPIIFPEISEIYRCK